MTSSENIFKVVKITSTITSHIVTFSDVRSISFPRLTLLEKVIEVPFRYKSLVSKKFAAFPVIPGFSLNVSLSNEVRDIIPSNAIPPAYEWALRCYKKLPYVSDNGPGFLNLMIDNDIELTAILANPFLVTRSLNCSKENLAALMIKAADFHVPVETITAELARYYLKQVMTGSGHSCYPVTFMYNIIKKEGKNFDDGQLDRGRFKEILTNSDLFTISDGHVYLEYVHGIEEKVIKKVSDMTDCRESDVSLHEEDIFRDICNFETNSQITLNCDQRNSMLQIFGHDKGNICIITGSGGTGKSRCVSCIESICLANKWSIELSAPTGMAANRLGTDAKTLHRLLKVVESIDDTPPKSFENLKCNVVICDESSMLDLNLFWLLLKSINSGTKLVLLGDPHQLPSVRYGLVLADLIQSGVVPIARLVTVYRQDKRSTILKIAKRILQRRMCPMSYLSSDDVTMIDATDESEIQRHLLRIREEDPDTVIIIPTKKGDLGTRCINSIIKTSIFGDSQPFTAGLKVMCCKNTYIKDKKSVCENDASIYNGQVGIVSSYSSKSDEVSVLFDSGQAFTVPARNLDMAYALTVHKVQGSEYLHTCIVLHHSHNIMLYDQILYTAVTRAKKKLTIISDISCIRKCISTEGSKRISLMGLHLKAKK